MSIGGRGPRINPLTAGVIAGVVILVIVGVMGYININARAPWASTHSIVADVTDADGISTTSDVRIAGRLVGQVTDVAAHGPYAAVSMVVDSSEWPLPADTVARIRLATLLGQKYVELVPGKASASMEDGAVIPPDRTRAVVDFDQVLDTFDKPTRDALTGVVRTLGSGLQGQEGTLQELMPDLRDLARHSTTPTGTLAARDSDVDGILVHLAAVADQLSSSRDQLAGVIDNLNGVTSALAAHQDALRGFIRDSDQLARTTDAVLGRGGAQEFGAALQRIAPVATDLNTVLHTIYPQTLSFQQPNPRFGGISPAKAANNLIYEIGDAISQADDNGNFLRQFLDVSTPDLLGYTSLPGTPSTPAPAGRTPSPVPAPSLPQLPGPPLPAPSLPPVPGLPGGDGSPLPLPTPSLPPLLDYRGGSDVSVADFYSYMLSDGGSG